MDEEFDTILYLIDELKAEDHNTRLHAINSLEQIAEAIGDIRTRQELVPYINELLEDDNQEVLLAIASKLGDLSNYVGGLDYLACLLPPLQSLSRSEETVVQDKAVQSINKIAEQLPKNILEEKISEVINNLSGSESYYGRVAACNLFHIPLSRLTSDKKAELEIEFIKLAKDESSFVRKVAAENLGKILQVYESKELMKLFDELRIDEYDSIRQMALESITKLLKNHQELLEHVKTFSNDKSWRVRYAVLDHLQEIIELENVIHDFLPEILNLFQDSESEVRCIALKKLPLIFKSIPSHMVESQLFPTLEILVKDSSLYVRLALMQSICQISPHLSSDIVILKLLPLVTQLLKDDNFEVRMGFAEHIQTFNGSLATDKISLFSVPLLIQLMGDSQWRVRLKAVECLAQLGTILGKDEFNEHLATPLMKWIEDPVFAVREAVLEAANKLAIAFDGEWLRIYIMPLINVLSYSPAFNKRMTALRIISKLGKYLDDNDCFLCLKTLSKDRVPNIRFNVAKTIKNLVESTTNRKDIMLLLDQLKNDTDMDVKYYAEDAVRAL
ncbi:unnamed protein product [Blepharisma stoltei]|uniref:TOG domain-containing protein n=1 Tax=Blepharisma stoltei TaxID=1481888 RepID=A0AAU9JW23_9CILI|nr:unnamed protein product [Blepharisma stoltei]